MVNSVLDLSVIIGGKAGEGINQAGSLIGNIFSELGYFVYINYDYPSLIRGGHNFAVIRASDRPIGASRDTVDIVLALNQDAVTVHSGKLKDKKNIIFDPAVGPCDGIPVHLSDIVKKENALPIMRNTCIIGAFAKMIGLEWAFVEGIIRNTIHKEIELNLKIAKTGFDSSREVMKVVPTGQKALPSMLGNEAIGLGLVKAGLDAYIAYPMTPSSGVLHYLAERSDEFSIKVIHPENEISVILMAQGFAYAGKKAAVGSAGGGFCLMVEGVSLAGMAEIPVAIVVSQRPGPSTGVPTYTCQADLEFVLTCGHGEFVRFIAAPGDALDAYFWSGKALNLAWKYSIPTFILSDKTLSEGSYSFDLNEAGEIKDDPYPKWDGKGDYKRYLDTSDGVSPLAFPGTKDAVIKATSYEHDEAGITVEEAPLIKKMQDKRMRKEAALIKEINSLPAVNSGGKKDSDVVLLCWGSNKGVCFEVAEELGVRAVQPVVMAPFPADALRQALKGAKKIICIENNIKGQLALLAGAKGFKIDDTVLKYDGRAFSVEELKQEVINRI